MKIGAYSVHDVASGAFGHPFFMPAQGLAIRMFGDWCRDANTPLGKHPGDFRLARIGSFDDEDATFESASPEFVSQGLDHVELGAPNLRVG